MPRGGPDGGDGGRGGSVILKASNEITDLSLYRRRSRWQSEPGAPGGGRRRTGRSGTDLLLVVPVGTMVFNSDGSLIADLERAGATAMVASGGVGGRGNVRFKSSTQRAPDYAEPGLKGEELEITLDLKLIADVGLVGPPNAGKSSLLRALTAARPKIGDYPFTTLDPELGVAEVGSGPIVMADIPGLIEGAAHGAGLGQRFLRHVERTKALVYVLDGSTPDPWQDLATVRAEVAQFSPNLAERPHLVAVNKVDLPSVRKLRKQTRRRNLHFVSALTGEGLPELVQALTTLIVSAPAPSTPSPVRLTKLPMPNSDPAVVQRTRSGFAVRGKRVERLLERTSFDSEAALARFQLELDRMGVNRALEAAGARPGDTVTIGDVEFEYQP